MAVYLDLFFLINFLVDLLLLLGSNRLAGFPLGLARAIPAALLGGVYAAACMLPGCRFLCGLLWRLVCLVGMACICFGVGPGAVSRCALFVFLSMALGGIALGLGNGSFWALLLAALGVAALSVFGFRGMGKSYVPVELCHGGKRLHLTALLDTGNSLKDPITGQQVLVVGAETAGELLGLTRQQLADPVGTLASTPVPGLRLIPYQSVGQAAGLLLAVKCDSVRIAGRPGSSVVAFAAEEIGAGKAYQALTGGAMA